MNSFQTIKSRIIDIVRLIVITRYVGVIDSPDDCNRRSSFEDPFSAVDANSNAILSFRCIYEYQSLLRGNIGIPVSLGYRATAIPQCSITLYLYRERAK